MPPFWPFRRRRKPPDVAGALEALKRQRAEEAARRAKPPKPFNKGEVRELMHVSRSLRMHESWEKLRRHMEEHPGEGQMVRVGGAWSCGPRSPWGEAAGSSGWRPASATSGGGRCRT